MIIYKSTPYIDRLFKQGFWFFHFRGDIEDSYFIQKYIFSLNLLAFLIIKSKI